MKKFTVLTVLTLLFTVSGFSQKDASLGSSRGIQTIDNFNMLFTFCDVDGSNETATQDACQGGTVYIKNYSEYSQWQLPINMGLVNADPDAVYRVSHATDNCGGYFWMADIPVGEWMYEDIWEIDLPDDKCFSFGINNFKVEYWGDGISQPYDKKQVLLLATKKVNMNAGDDQTVCDEPGVAQLNAAGASTYAWTPSQYLNNPNISNPTATVTSPTTFTVTGTKTWSGLNVQNAQNTPLTCSGTDQVTVNLESGPVVLNSDVYECDGNSINMNAGSSPSTYAWYYGGNLVGNSQYQATNSNYGTYTIIGSSEAGCTTTKELIVGNTEGEFTAIVESTSSLKFILKDDNPTEYQENPSEMHQWLIQELDDNLNHVQFVHIATGVEQTTKSNLPSGRFYKVIHNVLGVSCFPIIQETKLFYSSILGYVNEVDMNRTKSIKDVDSKSTFIENQDVNFTVFPNPVSEMTNLRFNSDKNQTVRVEVMNILGKLVHSTTFEASNGSNTVELYRDQLGESGLKVINIIVSDQLHSQKIVVK
jgi:hypothetical protein